jgi:HD domain
VDTLAGIAQSIQPENELERRIMADHAWMAGAAWGDPRPGHPEGSVAEHIAEVLANIDKIALGSADRERLRLIAIIHDTFKHRVDRTRPRVGENHHAMIARRFAERYIDDLEVLDVIELHDEAYNSWAQGKRTGRWAAAEARAARLLDRLGETVGLYERFYRADTRTGSKDREALDWFSKVMERQR